jgi:lactoylglutathione lyase
MKYLHTMIRVGDLDKSIQFYCEVLNFKLLSRQDFKDGEFTLVFLKAPNDEDNASVLELTYNWGVTKYEMGGAYGHMAYEVPSILEFQKKLQKQGHDLSWGPKKSPDGTINIAFIIDPDGYKIELLEPHC